MKHYYLQIILFCFGVSSISAQKTTRLLYSEILKDSITVIEYSHPSNQSSEDIVYVLDGLKFINNGGLKRIKSLEKQEKIKPYKYVFVSTIVNGIDKRNDYFFCNPKYLHFFENELIPTIEGLNTQHKRGLIGVSFGGLCAGYFMSQTQLFNNYALLSPITYPCDIITKLAFSEPKNTNVFVSSGTNDAENYTNPLIKSLETNDFNISYIQTKGGHNFENWLNQLEQVLTFFDTKTN